MRACAGKVIFVVVAAGAGVACGGPDASDEQDNLDLVDDLDPVDGGIDGAGGRGLSIAFDFRYDDAGFFDPAARATLTAAAASWSARLGDDFEMIPAGTSIRTRDPEAPDAEGMSFASDVAIDDLLVFVGCSDIDGPGGVTATSNHAAAIGSVTDLQLQARLQARYDGTNFEPWTGWISFDCDEPWYFDDDVTSTGDLPGTDRDFWTVAMHELAHVLGFGTAMAHFDLVSDTPAFTGAAASAEYGGPVPMTAPRTHFADGVMSDGVAPLMDQSRPNGERFAPTALDVAALADLGYELR